MNFLELQNNVLDGNKCPIDAMILINNIEKQLKKAKDLILVEAVKESEKYGKSFEHNGFNISRVEGGKWDFKACKTWADKKAELTKIETQLKINFQAMQNNSILIDGDTGEIMETPKYKANKTSLRFSATR